MSARQPSPPRSADGDSVPAFARLDGAMAAPRQSGVDTSGSTARAAGRPLDESVDEAILEATWRLLLQDGYSRMSIAKVAAEARVGKPAIYRRYRDKSELVAAVIADKSSHVPPVDTGSARGDLVAHLEFARRRFTIRLAGTLIVEETKHPELLKQFRAGMLLPRRNQIAAALERGQERGEVRPDLDCALAAHAVMGSFIFHYMTVGRPPKGWSEEVIDTLWPGFGS